MCTTLRDKKNSKSCKIQIIKLIFTCKRHDISIAEVLSRSGNNIPKSMKLKHFYLLDAENQRKKGQLLLCNYQPNVVLFDSCSRVLKLCRGWCKFPRLMQGNKTHFIEIMTNILEKSVCTTWNNI
jgi:hypothetical protein